MMSSYPKMLALSVVAFSLLVGFVPATSAVFPHGGEKSLWNVDCRDGLMKIIGRREGNFGCQGYPAGTKTKPIRSLRATPSPPPAPFKSQPGTQYDPPPPSSVS